MPIEEYRYILIDEKVITRADVQKLANELYSIYKQKGRGKNKSIEFTVHCDEKVIFTSQDPKIFSDDSPIVSKRVLKIRMQVAFESGEAIRIELEHDPRNASDNDIVVVGDNSNWVNGTLKRLEEITDAFKPQNSFFRRYNAILVLIFALTIGWAIIELGGLVMAWLFPDPPSISLSEKMMEWIKANKNFALVIIYFIKYFVAFVVGGYPTVYLITWLVRTFPSVELQIGPEHKLTEKRRREQIANFVSVTGIVAFLLQIFADFIKGIV